MGWLVPLIALALVVLGLSGCHRRLEEAEADADAATGTNPVGDATQSCGGEGCDEFLGEVEDLLADSATGREALEYMRDNNIRVDVVADGRGSRYSNMDRRIYLDRTEGTSRAAMALVHEVEHRRRLDCGDRPSLRDSTRDGYIRGMIAEETAATSAAIRTRQELIEAGHGGMEGIDYPGTDDYEGSQRPAEADALDRGASDEDARTEGRQAGEAAVESGFNDGSYTTTDATTGEDQTYPDYYGSEWDAAHPRRSGLGQ